MASIMQTLTYVTGSIAAGASTSRNDTVLGSYLNVHKIKVTPSNINAGELYTFAIYKNNTFLAADLIYNTTSFVGNLIDPIETDGVTTSERNEGFVCKYEDGGGASQLHNKIVNNGTVAKTYAVTILYTVEFDFSQTVAPIALSSSYAPIMLWDVINAAGTTNRVFGAAFQVHATAGGTGIVAEGETVGLFAAAERTGGSRPIWPANFVVRVTNKTNAAIGLEVDFDNDSGSDAAITNNASDQMHGVAIISGGANMPLEALRIVSSSSSNRWQQGILVANWNTQGIHIAQDSGITGSGLFMVPAADSTSSWITLRNAADAATVWEVLQNGTQRFANNVELEFFNIAGSGIAQTFVGGDDTWHFTAPPSNNILFTKNDGTTPRLLITAAGIKLTGDFGAFGTTPIGQQTVAGSRNGNAALASLITCLANYGLVVDTST